MSSSMMHLVYHSLFLWREWWSILRGGKAISDLMEARKKLLSFNLQDDSLYDEHNNKEMNEMISVIIPSYNEETSIRSALTSCMVEEKVEIIVVDGGSRDKTLDICRSFPKVQVMEGGKSRAECLNIGAKQAHGSILLFLHADTILPSNWVTEVHKCLQEKHVIVGSFRFQVDTLHPSLMMKVITWCTNTRSQYFQHPYGDQGLFIRRIHFQRLGGFPSLPFMEDFEFVDLVRRLYPYAVITSQSAIKTSARRWERNGVLRNTLMNQVSTTGLLYCTNLID